MRLLQTFLQGFIVAILPLLIVAFSIAFTLPNASIHKDSLNQENFYSKLNDQLKKNYENTPGSSQAIGYLVIGPIVNKLVTPDWLKNVSETNIDYVTRWLQGDSNILNFYLPTSDIEKVVREGIDEQASKIAKESNTNIETCSTEDLAKLKTEGYDSSKTFCLPAEVKDGSKKLSEVLGVAQQNGFNSLDDVLKNNPISPLSNQVRAESIISGANQVTLSRLNWARDQLLDFRSKALVYFAVFALLIAANLALVAFSNRKMLAYLRRLSWFISTSTLSLCVFWLLVTGGFAYLSSSLNLLLLPGFATSEIVNLLAWNLLRLSFNLILPALIFSGVLLLINIVMLILEKLNIVNFAKQKNQKLLSNKQPAPTINTNIANPTLDGQFKSMLSQTEQPKLIQNSIPVSNLEKPEDEFSLDNYPRETGLNDEILSSNTSSFNTSPTSFDQTSQFNSSNLQPSSSDEVLPDITFSNPVQNNSSQPVWPYENIEHVEADAVISGENVVDVSNQNETIATPNIPNSSQNVDNSTLNPNNLTQNSLPNKRFLG